MRKLKVLELFAGTRSIGKAFEKNGHEVYSVEWDEQHKDIDWYVDISTITAQDIIERFGYPDVIWMSPDCKTYSVAGISHHRRRNEKTGSLDPISEYAIFCDKTNKHCIDLVKELNPKLFFIENPRGGLRKMDFIKDIPRHTTTYCQYNNPLVERLIWEMKEKKCSKCGQIKDISEFYKNNARKDGFTSWCKTCSREQSQEYYANNKEACRKRLNKWRAENREYVRERDTIYRKENPDIEFKKQQKYRETHKEQLYLKGKKYREENKEYFYNKAKERKIAQKEVCDGTVTSEFKMYLYDEQKGKCGYCGCDLNESGKHLDHIVPISRGGLHTWNNVHWTCPTCNISKGNKLEEEWLKKERMKPSDLFTNHPNPQFKPPCKNGDPCHVSAPRGSITGTQGIKGAVARAIIPEQPCDYVCKISEEYIEELENEK